MHGPSSLGPTGEARERRRLTSFIRPALSALATCGSVSLLCLCLGCWLSSHRVCDRFTVTYTHLGAAPSQDRYALISSGGGLCVLSQWGHAYYPPPGSVPPPPELQWQTDNSTPYPRDDVALAPNWRCFVFRYYGRYRRANGGDSHFAVVVPYWFLTAFPAAVAAQTLYLGFRRRRGIHDGCCAACGYNLRASPGRCPECGTASPQKTVRAASSTPPA